MDSSGIDISKGLMVPRVLFMAMIVSLGVYLLVGWVLMSQGGVGGSELDPVVKYVLAGVGVCMIIVSVVFRRILMGGSGSDEYASGHDYAPPSSEGPRPGGGEISTEAAGKFNSVTIIGLAFCESCAIFGLVIHILYGDFRMQLILTVLSALGMALHFPREGALAELERHLGGGSGFQARG